MNNHLNNASAYPVTTERRLRRTAAGVALVLAGAMGLAGALRWREHHALQQDAVAEDQRRPIVSVVSVRSANGQGSISLPGETAAWYESTIYSRVSGYVAQWTADIGDKVKRGQTLAIIDTPELDAQLRAAEEQWKVAQAQIAVREAEAALATTTYQRWRDSPKGVVSDQEREEKKANHDSAQARLNASRAQAALNRAEVDHFRALTEFKRVVAPFDGTITERHVDVGNLVSAAAATATAPLYRMSQENPIRIFVDVPQSIAQDIAAHDTPATVRTPGNPGRSFAGHVTRSASALDPRARTLRVEIDLPNPHHQLVPGAYVDVSLQLNEAELVKVPASAMVFRARSPQVAVIDDNGHLHYRDVTIARDEGNLVALAAGVASGERVALNVARGIADGEAVEVRDVTPGSPGAPVAADGARK